MTPSGDTTEETFDVASELEQLESLTDLTPLLSPQFTQ